MANTTNTTTRIKHVFGNVLKLAIPLTLRTVTLEGGIVEVTDTDYTPSNHYPVVVQFVNGPLKYELDATIRDNYIAVVEDKGTIPVGKYAIVVLCRDDNGDPRRFKQRCVLEVVDVTADAGIEVGIEFEAQEWLLDGAIFLAVKGEDGVDGVGIESITTDETSVSGDYNQVTFHLTNGSSYTLNVRNGESTEQTLPANVVVDENYVHTDNNYTDADKQKIESVDKLFADAEYDRISRRLNFFKHGDTMHTNPLKSIDITDFIRDSRVSSFRIVDGNLTIKLNSDGNNEEFKVPITSINANYYTKSQVDNKLIGLMAKEDFVYEGSVNLKYGSVPEIVLSHIEGVSMYQENYARLFGTSNGHIKGYTGATLSDLVDYGLAPIGLVFLDKTSGLFYRWTGTTWQQVGDSSGGYEPPVGGIPKTDLASDVQASLGKADTALQSQEQADWNESDSSDPAYIKNKPTIPSAQVQTDWNASSGMGVILNKPNLASVATSGSYNDLQDKPTIPAAYDDTTLSGRVTALENAGFITTETDPNVPSWAKAESKPTYTAQEVGALPASTTIPSKTSDLTNDSGFTSNAGTITGITMNGASKGTSGVVDLGTVITAHQDISGKANASDVYTKTQTDTLLAGKQDTLAFDTTPTANSTKPVTSGGIKNALDAKADSSTTYNKTEVDDAIDNKLTEVVVTEISGAADIIVIDDADLAFIDEDGNIAMQVREGHVETQNFDSRQVATNTTAIQQLQSQIENIDNGSFSLLDVKNDADAALDITDENGNVVLRVTTEGHIQTKEFDSSEQGGGSSGQSGQDEMAYFIATKMVPQCICHGRDGFNGYRANTIPYYVKGYTQGFRFFETDVITCADGAIACHLNNNGYTVYKKDDPTQTAVAITKEGMLQWSAATLASDYTWTASTYTEGALTALGVPIATMQDIIKKVCHDFRCPLYMQVQDNTQSTRVAAKNYAVSLGVGLYLFTEVANLGTHADKTGNHGFVMNSASGIQEKAETYKNANNNIIFCLTSSVDSFTDAQLKVFADTAHQYGCYMGMYSIPNSDTGKAQARRLFQAGFDFATTNGVLMTSL